MKVKALLSFTLLLAACGEDPAPPRETRAERPAAEPEAPRYDGLPRLRVNQLAIQLDLPLFWAADTDEDGAVDPAEVRTLLFYPSEERWVEDGRFTADFDRAWQRITEAARAPAPTDARQRLALEEIQQAAPTIVETDLRELPEAHRAFALRMLNVAGLIDRLYAKQVGMTAMQARVANDAASRSIFRRNWGPECAGAATESNPACSAVAPGAKQPVDVYPTAMQESETFCQTLEAHARSEELLSPFSVVREAGGELSAVPYTEAYRELMQPIAEELRAARAAMTDPAEDPLRRYLDAAAQAFTDNRWEPADEAWAAMNAQNSRWYVRVGPDETYWDPCSRKAGFHLTFAQIDRGSLEWQARLTPLQERMERSLDELVEPYEARQVSFHMPDFINIVVNAGDDRDSFGGTIGQSLPNRGPVADEGRGRTVAMTNLYTDPDSIRIRREQASSLFTRETMALYSGDPAASNLSTILHEATHNLGPSHDYRVNGQTADEAFGGGMSAMLEELKAQSGALFYLAMLREEGIITEQREREVYVDSIAWALGHISRGMYTPSGQRKAYSQLAAVQVGFLMDQNVIRWDPEAQAANGTDRGAFSIDFAAFPAAARELMELVVTIKATNARARAEEIAARFVDGDIVPQSVIAERWQRHPRASFLYAVHR
jgi:hypothetical protein